MWKSFWLKLGLVMVVVGMSIGVAAMRARWICQVIPIEAASLFILEYILGRN